MDGLRRATPALVLAAGLLLGGPARAQTPDVDLVGGAFNDLTQFQLEGPANRKFMLLLSVFHVPGANFIPNVTVDIGTEFLSTCLGLPGFTGVLGPGGTGTTLLFLPYFSQLETFPLYVQLFHTGPSGNKLAGKSGVQIWTPQTKNTWKAPFAGADYSAERSVHQMTPLADGERVLVTGGSFNGITGSYGQDTAEIYDRRLETLTLLGATMVQARTGHTATLLLDGRVLIAGGADDIAGEPTNTAEAFDPVTLTFSPLPAMPGGLRALHNATRLADGRVLITGGTSSFADPTEIILNSQKTTVLFDPATDSFSLGPNMNVFRLGQSDTLLANGDVLVAGGYSKIIIGPLVFPVVSGTGEVYDAVTGGSGSFGSQIFMFEDRFGHGAVRLSDGRVLLAGGANGDIDPFVPQPELSWEYFDPASGAFDVTGPLQDGRILPSVNLLPGDKVLIAGGATGSFLDPISVATAEVWNPATETSALVASMPIDRAGHRSVTLPDGTALIAGGGQGFPGGQDGLTSQYLYQP